MKYAIPLCRKFIANFNPKELALIHDGQEAPWHCTSTSTIPSPSNLLVDGPATPFLSTFTASWMQALEVLLNQCPRPLLFSAWHNSLKFCPCLLDVNLSNCIQIHWIAQHHHQEESFPPST